MEQRKFLAMVGPLAQADMQKSGILASLTIAQAILESGWGASELATKANALFGIKADARWSGKAYSKDTKECYDGATYTTITALFRAYDSWAESVADHSAFLLANKRYAAVVGERDYKVACKAIKAAGYATDPGYPQKLIGLIEKYGLTVYDGKAEQEDKTSMNISITKKTSTHNTTAAAGRAIRYIVVHYTAGVTSKPGSAAGTASLSRFRRTLSWTTAARCSTTVTFATATLGTAAAESTIPRAVLTTARPRTATPLALRYALPMTPAK